MTTIERVTLDQVLAEHALQKHEKFHRKRIQRETEAKRNYRKYKLPEISASATGVSTIDPKNASSGNSGRGERNTDFYNEVTNKNHLVHVEGRTRSPTTDWATSKYGNEPPFPHFNFNQQIISIPIQQQTQKQKRGIKKNSDSPNNSNDQDNSEQNSKNNNNKDHNTVVLRDFAQEWIEEFGITNDTTDNNNNNNANGQKTHHVRRKKPFENSNEFVAPIDSRPYAKIISEQPTWSYQRQQPQPQQQIQTGRSTSLPPITGSVVISSPRNLSNAIGNGMANGEQNSLQHSCNVVATSPRELSKVYHKHPAAYNLQPMMKSSLDKNSPPLPSARSNEKSVEKKNNKNAKQQDDEIENTSKIKNKNHNEKKQEKGNKKVNSRKHNVQQDSSSSDVTTSSSRNCDLSPSKKKEDEEEHDDVPIDLNELEKQVQNSITQSNHMLQSNGSSGGSQVSKQSDRNGSSIEHNNKIPAGEDDEL